MLARKGHNDAEGRECSPEWIQQVSELLHQVYAEICRREERHFKVYGYIYSDEILLIICFIKAQQEEGLPLSFFISTDYQNSQRNEKLLQGLLDSSGVLMEEVLQKLLMADSDKREDIYSVHWQEHERNSQKYYFKVTRENIELTIEANRLLSS